MDKILELELSNGDVIRLTEDHLVVKEFNGKVLNWVESQNISVGDKLLVSPYTGVDGEATENHIFMRLLGYLFGDGHLPKEGKNKKTNNRVCFYTSIDQDADLIKKDLERYLKLVGHENKVSIHRRTRLTEDGIETRENCIYSNSYFLRERFKEYGCPVGKKNFDIILLNEIFSKLSLVDKANFIGGLLGAEGGSPKLGKNNAFNPWIKMGGLNGLDFLNFISSLLDGFGFASNITPSAKRKEKQHPTYVIQVIGGMDEFENFYRTFRYYYCNNKNIELSKVISYIWNKKEIINKKITARELCKRLRSRGEKVHFLHEKASEILGYKVNKRFALRSIYEDNGRPRISEEKPEITVFNEGVFVKVINKNLIEKKTTVYDIGIDHEDHNFIANGVVVHNCGNKAVLLDIDHVEVRKNIGKIMDDIFSQISFGVGRINNERVSHEIFDDELFNEPLGRELRQLAINQLGTVGAGNHYVDIFVDELNRVWCGVHFGSRGFGFNIAKHFITDIGGGDQSVFADPVLFDLNKDIGRDYWRWMTLAGKYAYAGRDWVCDKVAEILGAEILDEVHNHHNFGWMEECDGKEFCVVRKGCTPAFPGQKGFVGGSMGDISVILQGKDTDENKLGLYSTVHGAGRVMGRMQAKGKYKPVKDASGKKTGEYECVREPMIKKADMKDWLKEKGVTLRGADVDEAPQAYKRLPEVLEHHNNSIEILHTLTPIGVCMSPPDCRDPYKD